MRVFLQEDLNFLLTNRIPRRWASQFVGWFSKIEHPAIRDLSIGVWRFFSGLAEGRHEPNRRIGTFGLAVGAAARNFNCRSPDQPRALLGGGRGHVLRMHRHPHNFLVRKQLEQCEAPHARISQRRVT